MYIFEYIDLLAKPQGDICGEDLGSHSQSSIPLQWKLQLEGLCAVPPPVLVELLGLAGGVAVIGTPEGFLSLCVTNY